MEQNLSCLTILAADDNRANRLVLKKIIERLGHTADFVEDGRAAVAAYQDKDYDLLLFDIAMPNMSGSDALKAIREMETAQGKTPTVAIAVTANTLPHQLLEYSQVGFHNCLAKPINRDVLSRAISQSFAA